MPPARRGEKVASAAVQRAERALSEPAAEAAARRGLSRPGPVSSSGVAVAAEPAAANRDLALTSPVAMAAMAAAPARGTAVRASMFPAATVSVAKVRHPAAMALAERAAAERVRLAMAAREESGTPAAAGGAVVDSVGEVAEPG
jgi:hypothetical protein